VIGEDGGVLGLTEGNTGFRSGGVHAIGGRVVLRGSEFVANGSPSGGSGGRAMSLVGTTVDIRGSGFVLNGSAETGLLRVELLCTGQCVGIAAGSVNSVQRSFIAAQSERR
jgi:hypothetical protein